VLDRAQAWQAESLRRWGTRLVFLADELYLLAGRALPRAGDYEGYPQLENGIGIARRFIDRLHRLRPPAAIRPARRVTLVTGALAAPLIERLARKLSRVRALDAEVLPIGNHLFGGSVTVAGLLTGADILKAIARADVGDLVLLPGAAVREGVLLDDISVEELSARLGLPVVPVDTPADALQACRYGAGM
jgi:NifB/MoaA-like Fe-S oxidoreductase